MYTLKRFRINRKSILVNLIFSYILILLVCLSVYFLAFNSSKNVLKKEIENNYYSSLNQLKLVIDQRMLDLENIGTEMSLNNKLGSMLQQSYPLDGSDSFQMLQTITELHNWLVVNNFVEDIGIYIPNSNLILTHNSSYKYDDWYNIYYKNIRGMELEKFKDYLQQYHSKDYMPMSKMNSSGLSVFNFISYTHTLSINSSKKSNGTLFISVRESFIKDLLSSYDFISKKGNAFIIDEKNNVISAKEDFIVPKELDYKYFSQNNSFIDTKIGNEKYAIIHLKSDRNNWIYCFALPYSIFFQRANSLSFISVISICFCLFVGILIMYYFTRRNYTPIEGMLKLFSKLDLDVSENKEDEYSYIQSMLNRMLSERESMHKKIDSTKLELKNNFLNKLLRGRIEDEERYLNYCSEYNLDLSAGKFAVIILNPQESESIEAFGDALNGRTSSRELLQFVIKNIFEELIGKSNKGIVIEVDNKSVCIVGIKSKEKNERDVEDELLRLSGEGQELISEQYGVELFVSLSSIHAGFKGIADAYKEAVETMEYLTLVGDMEILGYESIRNNTDAFVVRDFENNKKLKNYIEAGDFVSAKELVKKIFEHSFFERKNPASLYMMKARMYGLVNLIIEAMYDLTAKYDYNFFQNINPEARFLKCDNLYKLQKEMENILDYAENYIKPEVGAKNDNLLEKILEFIKLNFADNNLSVAMISEELGMTVPYISKFFKKKMGTGLLDYIHSVRIQYAKELLKDESLQIKEVAEKSGYYNTVAFIRVFKKFEGISPGKYLRNA